MLKIVKRSTSQSYSSIQYQYQYQYQYLLLFVIYSVIVPIDPEKEPYVIKNCVFDYAKYKEKDEKDDKEKSNIVCDHISHRL